MSRGPKPSAVLVESVVTWLREHPGWHKRRELVDAMGVRDPLVRQAVADAIVALHPLATSMVHGYCWTQDPAKLEESAEEGTTKARALHVRASAQRAMARRLREQSEGARQPALFASVFERAEA